MRQNYEQVLRKEINDLDNQIYDLETYYLENTRDTGNLIRGFDNYLNARAPRNQLNKKPKIQNIERLFSLTSIRSKTSQAFDETFIGQKIDSSQFQPIKRNRMRNSNKGKSYNREDVEQGEGNSASVDNFMSMEESSNNQKARKKMKRLHPNGKGARK